LTVSLDEQPTANTLMLKVLDQIYVVSPQPTILVTKVARISGSPAPPCLGDPIGDI